MTTEAYLAEHTRLTAELDGLVDARPVAPEGAIGHGLAIALPERR